MVHGLGDNHQAIRQNVTLDVALFGNHGLSGDTPAAARIVTHQGRTWRARSYPETIFLEIFEFQ
jgi:hypothetical protein